MASAVRSATYESTLVHQRERRLWVESQRDLELPERILDQARRREQRSTRVVRSRRPRRVEDRAGAVGHAQLGKPPVTPDAGPRVIRRRVPRVQPCGGAQVIERRVQNVEAPVLVRHGPVVCGRRDESQPQERSGERRVLRFHGRAHGLLDIFNAAGFAGWGFNAAGFAGWGFTAAGFAGWDASPPASPGLFVAPPALPTGSSEAALDGTGRVSGRACIEHPAVPTTNRSAATARRIGSVMRSRQRRCTRASPNPCDASLAKSHLMNTPDGSSR